MKDACGRSRSCQAATIASAQIAASSRKDSSNAASRAGLVCGLASESPCAAMRHSSTTAHRLTPAAPPSMRTKLIALAPYGMSDLSSARIEPRLSEGRMKPSPMRPRMAHATSRTSGASAGTVGMSANDAVSIASPPVTST